MNTDELRSSATRLRVEAMRLQIGACNTLCNSAEVEIRFEEKQQAIRLLRDVKRTIERLERHIEESGHVPKSNAEEFREDLDQLKRRVSQIGTQVGE